MNEISPSYTALMAKIEATAQESAGCLLWTASVTGGVPVCRHEGSNVAPVRRLLWKAMGRTLDKRAILPSCKEPRCVAPAHLMQHDRGRPVGYKHNPAQRKNVAAAMRAKSVLSLDDVAAIRASDELQRVLAERYGVCRSTIRNIQSCANWQDTTNNPFWALRA